MNQETGKIKVSIDESDLKRLIQAADDAAEKILRHGAFQQQGLDLNTSEFDSAGKLKDKKTTVGSTDKTGDDKKAEDLTKKMLGDFEGMLDKTQKMLQTVGWIDDEVGKIFQMIMAMFSTLSKGYDLGKSILGFITGILMPSGGMAGKAVSRLLPSSGGMYPVNPGINKVVYVVPRDTVLRGRDIYTSWTIQEKINSSVTL